MSKLLIPIIGILLILSPQIQTLIANQSAPTDMIIVKPEDQTLIDLLQPILAINFTQEDSLAVQAFCLEFADVLKRDSSSKLIVDTADLRDRLALSSQLMFQETGISQRHPSLGEQMNNITAKYMGITEADGSVSVVDLDGEKNYRLLAIQAFEGIAWAVQR